MNNFTRIVTGFLLGIVTASLIEDGFNIWPMIIFVLAALMLILDLFNNE